MAKNLNKLRLANDVNKAIQDDIFLANVPCQPAVRPCSGDLQADNSDSSRKGSASDVEVRAGLEDAGS